MKANQKFLNNDDEAVSPVIAVILMVAITVVLAATVYVWQNGSFHPPGGKGVSVTPGASTTVTFPTPPGVLPALGAAYVKACVGSNCMQSNSASVGA